MVVYSFKEHIIVLKSMFIIYPIFSFFSLSQPSDILVFSRKMINTTLFPPNFELNRKLSTKMLPPDGQMEEKYSSGPKTNPAPSGTSEGASQKSDNAAASARKAILAFVASSQAGSDFRLNLDMGFKKQVCISEECLSGTGIGQD